MSDKSGELDVDGEEEPMEREEQVEEEVKDEEQMKNPLDESAVRSQLEEKLDIREEEERAIEGEEREEREETPISTPQTTSAATPTSPPTPTLLLGDRTPSPSPVAASVSPSSASASTEKLPKLSPSLSPNILGFAGESETSAPDTLEPGTLQGVIGDIANLVPNGNIRAIGQLQGNVLSELKATNKTLADFNIFSEEKYASISPDVLKLAKNLKGIKADLDYIYKKTSLIKMKLKGRYPEAFVETAANPEE